MTIKKRCESFFGMHSDFHAEPKEGLVIGETLKEEDIREICETLKPDFIQIDCKGHPGWSSYPTKVGNAMPYIKGDPLALWRKVTKECGVALYMHFSGVYEVNYCKENPGQCAVNKDGTNSDSVRLDGEYFEKFFIPQIGELAATYEVDGVWIDGDCWSVVPDYRKENIENFEKVTGIDLNGDVPKEPEDKYFKEFLDYTREEFRKTLKRYVDILHEKYPKLQICSNWAFSDHMPGKVCADVDFLSGDLNPENCFNSARYAGRMLAQQNKTWDLMSWDFRYNIYKAPLIPAKHITQILQEAASVISLGGAYQNNISQFPDGSPNVIRLKKMKELSEFMRKRQDYCFKGKIVHQAAILVSTYDRYFEMTKPFTREGMEKLMGLTALFCDSGQSLELVSEHTLENNYDKYPLIVVPELYHGLEEETVKKLECYVKNGGSLVLVGASTCRMFSGYGFGFDVKPYSNIPEVPNWAKCNFGHNISGSTESLPCYFKLKGDDFGVTEGAFEIIAKDKNTKIIGRLCSSLRGEGESPFACTFNLGKGKVCAVGMNLGTQYHQGRQYLHRELIKNIAKEMYEPLVTVENARGLVEIVCLEKEGKLLVQLVNANGNHRDPTMATEEFIPAAEDIKLSLKKDSVEKIVLQPEGKEIPFEQKDGKIVLTIPRVEIHNIAEVVKNK